MIDLSSTAIPDRASVDVPLGRLVSERDRVCVTMVIDAGARHRVRAILDRLERDAGEWFDLPTTIEDSGDRLVLDYAIAPGSLPFAAALPRWRSSLPVYLPELVSMARYLERCAAALCDAGAPVVIAPVWLRYTPAGRPGSRGAFRMLALPVVGIELADWACASPDTWRWMPGDALLGQPSPNAAAYAVGAALYTVVAGDLFPVRSVAERFRRALRGQVGTPGALAGAARGALPSTFIDEIEALAGLVTRLLAPDPPPDWRDQLAAVGDQLHPYRTAVRWEYEGEIKLARQILERFAATAPSHQVPWAVLARLRDRDGDEPGALAAALEVLRDGDTDGVRGLLLQVRRVARELDPRDPDAAQGRIAWITEAVAALDRLGDRLGDTDRIHLAYIEARYLRRVDRARLRLAARVTGAWNEILRGALLARLHAADADWTGVARLCEDTRRAIRAMPGAGGSLGAYTTAYLHYLDGVAHFGAIGVFVDSGYLADAFDRFAATLDGARPICAPDDELIVAAIDWLGWIGSVANHLQLATARVIASGIAAYLAAHGVRRADTPPGVPALIWFDEDRLLALSEAS